MNYEATKENKGDLMTANKKNLKKYSTLLVLELKKLKEGANPKTAKWLENLFGPKAVEDQIRSCISERRRRDKEVKIKRKRKIAFNKSCKRYDNSKIWRFLHKAQWKLFKSYVIWRQKTTLDF